MAGRALPQGLSTLPSLSGQGLLVETLPQQRGFKPALPCCSAEWHQQSQGQHFLTSRRKFLKHWGYISAVGFYLEGQEQVADAALCSTPSPSMGGCEEGPGMEIKALQRTPPGPGTLRRILAGLQGRSQKE